VVAERMGGAADTSYWAGPSAPRRDPDRSPNSRVRPDGDPRPTDVTSPAAGGDGVVFASLDPQPRVSDRKGKNTLEKPARLS